MPPAHNLTSKTLDAPLTANAIFKIGSIFVSVITLIISLAWYAGTLNSAVASTNQDLKDYKHEQAMKEAETDKQETQIQLKLDQHDKAIAGIKDELDVAVTILNRIDKKVGSN